MTAQLPAVILGGGGHAKVIIATLRANGREARAVYEDDATKWGQTLLGVPIVGPLSAFDPRSGCCAIIGVGANDQRRRIAETTRAEWLTLVHPQSHVADGVVLGVGSVVFAGSILQPDTRVGAHCIINTGTTVDHDCLLGDYVHLCPGVHIAGGVNVASDALVGTAAVVIPGMRIGAGAIVGAGAVCTRDVEPSSTVVGVPARRVTRSR